MNPAHTEKLVDGTVVQVRPINRDDVEREREFVEGLSPETKHYRFLGGIGHLSESQLLSFCDIDLQHEMAFVALVKGKTGDKQVGVARYVADPKNQQAEIAITVADPYAGKGLDRILLDHLMNYARNFGMTRLFSVELAENAGMKKLMRQSGFRSVRDPDDATQVIYSLDLSKQV
ncbi:MAG TPA: GNAT family N-acetyltransferase [Woeseiaceae bacterium]|jgi:acetyltransferase